MKKKPKKKETEDENRYWKWDKGTLTKDDWDFRWVSECDKNEQEAILFYECGRDLTGLRELASVFGSEDQDWPFELLLPLDLFPDTSAKQIPKDILKNMADWCSAKPPLETVDLIEIGKLYEKGFLQKRYTQHFTFQKTNSVEIVAFEIDWNLGPGELV